MLKRIIEHFQEPKLTPITLTRKSAIPVVILRNSSIQSERAVSTFGRMA